MNSVFRAALAAVVLLAVGCAGKQVTQDYDPQTDFSTFRTYAWQPQSSEKSGDPRLDAPLLHKRIRTAIDTVLQQQGYRKAGDAPDFYVQYYVAVKERMDSTRSSVYMGGATGGGGSGVGVSVGIPLGAATYEEGTLVIDFLEPTARKLVWRGSTTRRLKYADTPEENEKLIQDVVARILAQFPPGAGGKN